MNKLLDFIKNDKILVADGAWGTLLFEKGLISGDCPEEWNLTHSAEVFDIAESYVNAGSDIISTNSFGANKFKLMFYNLEEKLSEICQAAVRISRSAAGKNKLVMASMGPTGKFLITGEVSIDELYNTFSKQAIAFEKEGADGVCIETFYDLQEAEQAIKAVKHETSMTAVCSFTFDKTQNGFSSLMGISPEKMTEALIIYGADIIGTNCGRGFEDMIEITKRIRTVSKDIPVIVQANAGLPEIIDGKLSYLETPEKIRNIIPRIIDAGANIIGGCCGTTPEHIKVIRKIVDECNFNKTKN